MWREVGEDALVNEKYWRVKSFMKDEGYLENKHARGINSRTDAFKCLVGPMFHAIEVEIFKMPEFVKYVSVRDRAKYIMEELYFPGYEYVITDYTSFECGFVREMMGNCEFIMYIYMIRHTPLYFRMLVVCWDAIGGENVCTFKYFVIWVLATRMSGEMCTSLGNGWSNFCLMSFVAYKSKVTFKGEFEGDDGLAVILTGKLDPSYFERLGMRIKLEKVATIEEASFCGLLFDTQDMAIITNPIKVLANFAWGKAAYRNASSTVLRQLLRAKALSFMYQYPACPIVTELAYYAERMTRNQKIRKSLLDRMDAYDRRRLQQAMVWYEEARKTGTLDSGENRRPIGMNTRILMERQFGVSVHAQLTLESMFRSKHDLEPISIPLIEWPEDLVSFQENYVLQAPVGDDAYIGEWWNKMPNYKAW